MSFSSDVLTAVLGNKSDKNRLYPINSKAVARKLALISKLANSGKYPSLMNNARWYPTGDKNIHEFCLESDEPLYVGDTESDEQDADAFQDEINDLEKADGVALRYERSGGIFYWKLEKSDEVEDKDDDDNDSKEEEDKDGEDQDDREEDRGGDQESAEQDQDVSEQPRAEAATEGFRQVRRRKNVNLQLGLEDFVIPKMQNAPEMVVDAISCEWRDTGASRTNPYCPVFVSKNPETGKLIYTAYVSGVISNLMNYVSLVDTLLLAQEGDIYYIMLDSPGGAVDAGSVIASAIWKSKARVITIARGFCASAAALIHAAPKPGNNLISDMGILMLHMSSHADRGVSTRILVNAQQQVRYVNENLLRPAIEMGYITPEELAAIQNGAEIFISAQKFRERVLNRYQEEGEHD